MASPSAELAGEVPADIVSAPTEAGALNWGAKVAILGGGVMISLAFGAILPVLPEIEKALAHGPQDSFLVKQLFGIVGLSIVVGAPLAGFLIDRIGARPIMLIGCALFCVAGTAGLYLTSLPWLLASRLLVGVAAALIDTTSIAIVNTRLLGQERAKWNGLHIAFAMLTLIFMQPTVGYIARFGWRAPFALYVLALPLGLVTLVALDNWRPQVRQAISAVAKAKFVEWFPFRYAALALIIGIMTYLPVVYGPFLMTEKGASGPQAIAFVLMGVSVVGVIMSSLYGRASRQLSINRTFVVGFLLVGAGTLIATLTSTFAGVIVGLLLTGSAMGWFVPNLMTGTAERVAQEQQGRAAGLVRTMHDIAAPLCVVIVEPVAKKFGAAGAMMMSTTLAGALLLFFACEIVFRRRAAAA